MVKLGGQIFSSPVFISAQLLDLTIMCVEKLLYIADFPPFRDSIGRILVGCRDNNLYCISLRPKQE
eukprot:758941-Hanusia_phi.AAC.9